MPSEQTLAILEGIAQGADKLTTNLFNIMQAKNEARRDRELFDIKVKKAKLDLKASEADLDPELLDLKKRKLQSDINSSKLLMDVRDATIRKTEGELKQKTLLSFLAGTKQLDDLSTEQASYISNIGGGGVDINAPTFDEGAFTESLRTSLGISQEEAARELLGVAGKSKGLGKITTDYINDLKMFGEQTDKSVIGALPPTREAAQQAFDLDREQLEVEGADVEFIQNYINNLSPESVETGEQGAFDRILQGLGTLSRFFLKRSE